MMISVVIGINNKAAGHLPCVPRPIIDCSLHNLTCLINTDIVRTTFFSRKNILQEIEDIGRRFSLGKFGSSNDNTMWCKNNHIVIQFGLQYSYLTFETYNKASFFFFFFFFLSSSSPALAFLFSTSFPPLFTHDFKFSRV